ncbi:hypothetical protein [Pseudomonas piscis]|uniref:hypothetical protein n=2 Tax=Pseudomonas piscis TaxID=2614538 RepID=UPI001F2873BE|nr:hypothetical protein [Pseudomonas piscis]
MAALYRKHLLHWRNTSSMTDQLISTFIEKWLDFDLQLREKRGLDGDSLEVLMDLLEQIEIGLEGQGSIPKNLAGIFLDMWGSMTSSADMYDQDMQSKIYQAADHLADCARGICMG